MAKPITENQVKKFYSEYAKAMDVRFIEKKHWGIVATYLKRVLNRYLKKYASYVPALESNMRPMVLKNCIILNYNIGDKMENYGFSTAVHEAEHVIQQREYVRKGGKIITWYSEYFKDSEFRALQEGGAKASEAEFDYYYCGMMPQLPQLDDYFVSADGQKLSDEAYQKRIDRVKELGKGSTTSLASMHAIHILNSIIK